MSNKQEQGPVLTPADHAESIDTLTEWSNEDGATEEDRIALEELASEMIDQRERDGLVSDTVVQRAKAAKKIAEEEAEAQQDNDWRTNPGAH